MGDATGVSQKNAVIKMMEDWKVKENVIPLLFDTTASNTGLRNGCAVLIEKDLNRSLLCLACRHHVYEVHMKNIWQDLSRTKLLASFVLLIATKLGVFS